LTVNEAGIGTLAPEFYYALVTMHGTIIVFFVLTAGLSGTFSNLLIPLQVGARDMASPFLNMLSYWFFFLAGVDHVLLPVFEHGTILGRLDSLSAA
jgi:cytochrome c oxidase subunit 1